MIHLYELQWSHYCEKVQWALNFKGLAWKSVKINAFTKAEMKQFPPNTNQIRTVPMIYDTSTNHHVYESSNILRHLENTYPNTPSLFPGTSQQQAKISETIMDLDTQLGLPMRRMAYAQCMLECPEVLSELFLTNQWKGLLTWNGLRQISSTVIGIVLLQRFDMHLNESHNLYELVEDFLIPLSTHLKNNPFLLDDCLSAADITLATHLRGLRIIPFFKDNAQLATLFSWQSELYKLYAGENDFIYENRILEAREKRAPYRRRFNLNDVSPKISPYNRPPQHPAQNDQKRIGGLLRTAQAIYHYFFTLRKNKVRQWKESETIR